MTASLKTLTSLPPRVSGNTRTSPAIPAATAARATRPAVDGGTAPARETSVVAADGRPGACPLWWTRTRGRLAVGVFHRGIVHPPGGDALSDRWPSSPR